MQQRAMGGLVAGLALVLGLGCGDGGSIVLNTYPGFPEDVAAGAFAPCDGMNGAPVVPIDECLAVVSGQSTCVVCEIRIDNTTGSIVDVFIETSPGSTVARAVTLGAVDELEIVDMLSYSCVNDESGEFSVGVWADTNGVVGGETAEPLCAKSIPYSWTIR